MASQHTAPPLGLGGRLALWQLDGMSKTIAALLLILLLAYSADARVLSRQDPELEFRYAWPETPGLPRLDAWLRKQAEAAAISAKNNAVQAWKGERDPPDQDPPRHSHETDWVQTAATPRIMALRADTGFYTGGAHEGMAYGALLWDWKADRVLQLRDIFTAPAQALAMLERDYCAQLKLDQAERRGDDFVERDFRCPDMATHPVELTGGKTITGFQVLLEPYAAGSWAEGPYEVETRFRPSVLRLVKSRYRSSFSAPPPLTAANQPQ
jgi:hypothetical protein